MRSTTPLYAANEKRRERGAAASVEAVRTALDKLGATAPPRLAAAGRLRLAHPDASLRELGERAEPPATKDTVAALLRRLTALGDGA